MRGFRELSGPANTLVGALLLTAMASAEPARIDNVLVEREENQLLVSFELINAFDADFLERVSSGLPTGFRYQIKLERLRRYWLNPSLHKSELEVIAMYNAITREYLVNYKQDGRPAHRQPHGKKRSRTEPSDDAAACAALPGGGTPARRTSGGAGSGGPHALSARGRLLARTEAVARLGETRPFRPGVPAFDAFH